MNNNGENKVVYLRIDDIIPNRFQPREVFDETGLEELADSIREHGVIQPIIVRQMGDKYELIAGERRTKASALAGLTTIPAIIKNMDDKESAKVSLLENLQRKNLSAIEEARTYKRILELDNMTQEDLAKTMGKSQPLIANKLRLLALPEEIQDALIKNQISERHARSLLNVKNKEQQLILLERIRNERLTVRDLDVEIKKIQHLGTEPNIVNTIPDSSQNTTFEFNGFNEGMNSSIQDSYTQSYGNMGLDDYKSHVNNNMFNNIPSNYQSFVPDNNQFNNMPFGDNFNTESEINPGISQLESTSFINQVDSLPATETESIKKEESIDRNSFISQLDNNLGNVNQDSNTNNNYGSLGSLFDNNQISNNIMTTNEVETPDSSNIFISNIQQEKNSSSNNQFIPSFEEQRVSTIGSFNNNVDSSINHDFNNNFAYSEMNTSTNFENPEFSSIVSPIESNLESNNNFGFESNIYNQNQGDLFNQPLDITEVSNKNSYSYDYETPTNGRELNDMYENILNANPVPIENEFNLEKNNYNLDTNLTDNYETNNYNLDTNLTDNYETNNYKEEKSQYISLDPVKTIFDTRGAVLELKKTTDRIKQNNINMESEEIDFDDYYQIIIKIKKDQI